MSLLKFDLEGETSEILKIIIDPGIKVVAKPGAMVAMDSGVDVKTVFSKPAKKTIWQRIIDLLRRIVAKEPVMLNVYENIGTKEASVYMSADHLGDIVPFKLGDWLEDIICRKEVFLAADYGVKNKIELVKSIDTAVFGTSGFVLQRYSADEGHLFLHTGGKVVKKRISQDTLYIDAACLLAYTSGLTISIKVVKSPMTAMFGGEGLFLVALEGTGTVWIQSVPLERMANALIGYSSDYKRVTDEVGRKLKKLKKR